MADWPTGKRVAASAAFCLCVAVLIITLFQGFSTTYPMRLFQGLAAVIGALGVIVLVIALIIDRMSDYREPADEDEFEELVLYSEQLAADNLAAEPDEYEFADLDPYNPHDFEELVREALDELPDLLRASLHHVAIVISDKGRRAHAYGLYQGGSMTRDDVHHRIVIFRDTLLRDFGRDPDELRSQVTRTVRHELAHHLGADELGVRELGL
jgi:predicted Zn-dependent protease with MMP-like domain